MVSLLIFAFLLSVSHCSLIYIFLITNDVEYLLMAYLLSISSFVIYLFKSFAHFLKTALFDLLFLTCKNSLYTVNTSHLSIIKLTNVFFQSVGCLFIFLSVFEEQKLFIFKELYLQFLLLWFLHLLIICSLPNSISPRFSNIVFLEIL